MQDSRLLDCLLTPVRRRGNEVSTDMSGSWTVSEIPFLSVWSDTQVPIILPGWALNILDPHRVFRPMTGTVVRERRLRPRVLLVQKPRTFGRHREFEISRRQGAQRKHTFENCTSQISLSLTEQHLQDDKGCSKVVIYQRV
jgi:hypothetical protein